MRLVIVSLDAYSLFDTSTHFIFGGAELRSSLFAKELSKFEDVEVTVVTRDQGRGRMKFGNIILVPHPAKKGKGYWVEQNKFVTRIKNKISHPKEDSSVDFFFDELKATHVLSLGMSPESVEFFEYSKKANIPFIFGCASDIDLSDTYLEKNSPIDISGNDASKYQEVIRNASLIIVQSEYQQKILKERFGRNGIILPNPVSPHTTVVDSSKISSCDVLWIGKTSSIKRPELFLELAVSLPDLRFRMVLNNTNAEKWNEIISNKPKNLEIIESVPLEEIENYFKQTALLVNTSLFEGFPNTFLQAGKWGVPVVSMIVDPDQFISKNKFGIVSGDNLSALKEAIHKLLTDPVFYKISSDSIRTYVMRVHDVKKVSKELVEQILKLKSHE